MTVAIQTLGTFQLHFPEEDWADTYNAYEIVRSRVSESGPYEQLHDSSYHKAGFLIPYRTSYDVVGTTLALKVNRTVEVSVEFTDSTPVGVEEAFNTAMPSVLQASFGTTGIFVETFEVGYEASIEVTDSEAWVRLHMEDTYFFGSSSYPPLYSGQSVYEFFDPSCQDGWYYKSRYVNRQSGAKSSLSPATLSEVNVGVDPSELIRGDISVTDPAGRPVENILVMLDVPLDHSKPDMVPAQLKKFTDAVGRASFLVRRGVKAVLSIAGTSLYRKIQVPSTGDSFTLVDESLSLQPDAYAVQVPDVKVGERRSM